MPTFREEACQALIALGISVYIAAFFAAFAWPQDEATSQFRLIWVLAGIAAVAAFYIVKWSRWHRMTPIERECDRLMKQIQAAARGRTRYCDCCGQKVL